MSNPISVVKAWKSYEREVVPPDAPRAQRIECSRAFYAGAAAMFYGIVNSLEPGEEATEADLGLFDRVDRELKEYAAGLAAEYAAGLAAELRAMGKVRS